MPNPYAPPRVGNSALPHSFWSGELQPTKIRGSAALGIAWEVFKANLGAMTLLGLVLYLVAVILNALGLGLIWAQDNIDSYDAGGSLELGSIALALLLLVTGVVTTLGSYSYCLQLLRTGRTDWSAFWQYRPLFWQGVLLSLALGMVSFVLLCGALMVFVGMGMPRWPEPWPTLSSLAAALAASTIVFIPTIAAGPLLVDRRLSAGEALSQSLKYSDGNLGAIAWALPLATVLGYLFTAATISLGAILFLPYLQLLVCVLYLLMTGQQESISWRARGK